MKYLIVFVLAIVLFGCTDRSETFYLKSKSGNGIHVSMPILYHGKTIGTVVDVKVKNSFAIVEVSLRKNIAVCQSSKFRLIQLDFFDAAIIFTNTCNKGYYNGGDTILVDFEEEFKKMPFNIHEERRNNTLGDSSELDSIHVWVEEW